MAYGFQFPYARQTPSVLFPPGIPILFANLSSFGQYSRQRPSDTSFRLFASGPCGNAACANTLRAGEPSPFHLSNPQLLTGSNALILVALLAVAAYLDFR